MDIPEILAAVFVFIDPKSLKKLMFVNRFWRELALNSFPHDTIEFRFLKSNKKLQLFHPHKRNIRGQTIFDHFFSSYHGIMILLSRHEFDNQPKCIRVNFIDFKGNVYYCEKLLNFVVTSKIWHSRLNFSFDFHYAKVRIKIGDYQRSKFFIDFETFTLSDIVDTPTKFLTQNINKRKEFRNSPPLLTSQMFIDDSFLHNEGVIITTQHLLHHKNDLIFKVWFNQTLNNNCEFCVKETYKASTSWNQLKYLGYCSHRKKVVQVLFENQHNLENMGFKIFFKLKDSFITCYSHNQYLRESCNQS